MILTSLLTGEKYFWIKVPRTATTAYQDFFLNYYSNDEITCEMHDPAKGTHHMHYTYTALCKLYNQKFTGVTVIRHPLKRFISSLHKLKELAIQENFELPFLESTTSCIDFLSKHFGKNCHTTASFQDLFLGADPIITISFFYSQIYFIYNPKVIWFKYENIEEFNDWITENLGYDLSLLTQKNNSDKKSLSHIDFTHPDFIKTVENMFYDDYKVLGYSFQYLN